MIAHPPPPTLSDSVDDPFPKRLLIIDDITPNLRDHRLAPHLLDILLLRPTSNPTILHRELRSSPPASVATPPTTMPPDKPVGLKPIAQRPIVTFSRNTHPYIVVREMFARAGLPVTIHASASLATVVRMALDGIGIAVIPPAILDNVAAVGRLRPVKTTVKLPSLNFVVAWPSFAAFLCGAEGRGHRRAGCAARDVITAAYRMQSDIAIGLDGLARA